MHQKARLRGNTILVVIDAEKMTYTRYVNSKADIQARAGELLTREEVETFRLNPKRMIDDTPSDAA
jgi:hypothetical protein